MWGASRTTNRSAQSRVTKVNMTAPTSEEFGASTTAGFKDAACTTAIEK